MRLREPNIYEMVSCTGLSIRPAATGEREMFAQTMIAGIAAIGLTAVEPTMAVAAPAAKEKGLTAAVGTSGATDFSAQRRRYYRGGGGGAAAAAAFAGIVGTGIAIAAANSRPYYYDSYGYGPPVTYY